MIRLEQRFSIPVLAPPPLHIPYVTLIALDVCSIRTQVPYEVDITGYSAVIPVRSEHIYSIQSAYKCARRELKLYIFTEVYDITLVRAWRRCVAQIHEWMFQNEVNSGSREQWTLCREHVNRNTVHAWSALLTSWLSESGVLTKRDMQNMQSGGGGREDWNWEPLV